LTLAVASSARLRFDQQEEDGKRKTVGRMK
jgi:hypothetical protein